MRFRNVVQIFLCAVILMAALPVVPARGQNTQSQSGVSAAQRIEVMRSRLETMRRTLNSAIAGLNAKDGGRDNDADDPRARLRGLEKEVGSLLNDVNDVRGKQERADRYDPTLLDKLEAAVADLDTRVQAGMRATASDRRTVATDDNTSDKKKKKGGLLSRIFGGGDDKYDELIGTVAPGRDRQLFEEATREARKDHYQVARDLYTVIITTYPESPYLPLAKLAIADTFYLEGTTSALIQAAQQYQDWLTFFPTDPLADDVLLKMAEVEMRRMGLPDREVTAARKAEQRLKVLLQQFPNTSLRPDAEIRLREVQENLAMHNLKIGNFYFERYLRGAASNPKGAQSRYREIVERFPNFSLLDRVLYRLAITYIQEEEPDEAAKYLSTLLRDYPNSEFAENAREQLANIGAAAPEPDAAALKKPTPVQPGFFENIKNEILGTTPVTVNKDGVIIAEDEKAADLIQKAIENNGTIPDSYNTMPVSRTAPARRLENTTPAPKPATDNKGVTTRPTQPGPPRTGSDPTQPQGTPTTQPSTTTPPASNTSGEKGIKP